MSLSQTPRWARLLSILGLLGLVALGPRWTAPVGASPGILYATSGGSGDCTSWANACDLATALTQADAGAEIRVAAGTYMPTTSTDRNATFPLKTGVAVYGGFPAAGGDTRDSDPATNGTVLSGNIGDQADTSDNVYHVVTGSGTDASAILDGFIITGGNANGYSGSNYWGGGLYNGGGNPTLTNLAFVDNYAIRGGGLYSDSGGPKLDHVTFSDNEASTGGGMFNSGGSPLLDHVIFNANHAESGGGMFNGSSGSPTLADVTFEHNSALYYGGGMDSDGNPTLTRVTFNGNTADSGGGMYNNSGNPVLTDLTFSTNTASGTSADDGGGGLYNAEGNPTLTNVTFSGNAANYGGGLLNAVNSTVRNSILWGDTGGEIAGPATVTHSDVQGGYVGTGNINLDPLFGDLGNYGGSTETLALLPSSPAIDAGSSTVCPATDQRGVSRPQGSGCDMGAFEARPFTLSVTSGANQTAPASTAFADPLVVTVTGTGTDPVAGGRVTFTAPPQTGPSAIFSGNPATIGSNGAASVTAQANDIANTISGGTLDDYTVTASATGATGSVTFTLHNAPTAQYLIDQVNAGVASGSIKVSLAPALEDKLQQAAAATSAGDCITARNIYQAFINSVKAQSGKGITKGVANTLIAEAVYLKTHCP